MSKSGPLAGVTVLDLSAVVSGPMAAVLLADQGADVIKVEPVGRGDIQRNVGSNRGGMSGNFHVLNRGKRSLALDLKHERGRDLVARLAERSDVVIQNFRPGVTERLGVGYEQLRARNPRLVYLSISGFGPDGPHADRRAYDPIIQARSGVAHAQGSKLEMPPQQVQQLIMDKITAFQGAQAVTAALVARARTGEGQHITLSMLDAGVAFLWPDAGADSILQGEGIEHRPSIGGAGQLVEFADGWATTMTLSDPEFEGLCRVYGVPELIGDERFSSVRERTRNRDAWTEIQRTLIAPIAKSMTLDQAEERFFAEHVPFGRVHAIDQVHLDPQIEASGILRETSHPVAGPLREARPAARFSGTPAEAGGPAPRVGQHSREILAEIGLADEAEALIESGVVGAI